MKIIPEETPIAGVGPGWISCEEMQTLCDEWHKQLAAPTEMRFYWRGQIGQRAHLAFFHPMANEHSKQHLRSGDDTVFYLDGGWDDIESDFSETRYKIPEDVAIVVKT